MNDQNQTNSKSITSLIFGILAILIPMFGIIFGIVGILYSKKATKEILKTYEGGKGLATSGLICSVIGIIIQLFFIITFILYASVTTAS